jgi:hypothetical protein
MIDNIKRYRDDFKGNRIPKFEEKFVKERIFIAHKNRARELKNCSNAREHDRRPHRHVSQPSVSIMNQRKTKKSGHPIIAQGSLNHSKYDINGLNKSTSRRRAKTNKTVIDKQAPPGSLFSVGGLYQKLKKQ